jgi:osmotically-inducible protein OsmY
MADNDRYRDDDRFTDSDRSGRFSNPRRGWQEERSESGRERGFQGNPGGMGQWGEGGTQRGSGGSGGSSDYGRESEWNRGGEDRQDRSGESGSSYVFGRDDRDHDRAGYKAGASRGFGAGGYGGTRQGGGSRVWREEDNRGGRTGSYGYGRSGAGRDGGSRGEDWSSNGRGGSGGDTDRGWLDKAGDEVASWFGDEEADRRRRMDAQNEHRGRGPKGYRRSDDRIRDDVNDRLTEDPQVDASEIEVSVSESEVTISGTVDSRFAKRRAEDIVEAVSGVTHVQNNLRVRQNGGGGTLQSGTGQPFGSGGATGGLGQGAGGARPGVPSSGSIAGTSGSGVMGAGTSGTHPDDASVLSRASDDEDSRPGG